MIMDGPMKQPVPPKVFITARESVCDECGEELGRKAWIMLAGDREIGPVPVPREVSDLCKVGWDISGIVVKTLKGWRLAEVWNVLP